MRFFIVFLALLVTLSHAVSIKQQVASMLGCDQAAAVVCFDNMLVKQTNCDGVQTVYNTMVSCLSAAGCPTSDLKAQMCVNPDVKPMNCPLCNGGAPSSASSILILVISMYFAASIFFFQQQKSIFLKLLVVNKSHQMLIS